MAVTSAHDKSRRLGRGLGALISPTTATPDTADSPPADPIVPSPLQSIPVDAIDPNPFQPRRDFDPAELRELEHSMRENGLLQPITVRKHAAHRFQLIAGERRLRAAKRLGWNDIPAIIKELDDRQTLTLALVENLQRADLNPLDEALGYQRLIEEFAFTPPQVAEAVGKDRSTVANLLRLLQLPEGIRKLLRDGKLTGGHARTLLSLPSERAMLEAARAAVDNGLSVRELERWAQRSRTAATPKSRGQAAPPAPDAQGATSAEWRRVQDLLRKRLQTDVRIVTVNDDRSDITISFYSSDDLHRLVELILGRSTDEF
jgi:ParB family transcriptional regulator, chromosome partitioning protein